MTMQARSSVVTSPSSKFIDPSIARGIRSSYFGHLDNVWKSYLANEKAEAIRLPVRSFATAKSFRKEITRVKKQVIPRFLPISEITVSAGKREAWMMLTLANLSEERNDQHFQDAALVADVITYPANGKRSIVPVFFKRHAIERIIQRAGIIDLPLSHADIEAIHAEFSSALVWGMAASTILKQKFYAAANLSSIIIPSDHGFFLGEYLKETDQLIFNTYVDNSKLWDEERYALDRLRKFDNGMLALTALEGFNPGWLCIENSLLTHGLIDVWQKFGWLLRERYSQKDLESIAWNSHQKFQSVG
jgi:hypothetical protein